MRRRREPLRSMSSLHQHLVEEALGSLLRQEGNSVRIQVIDDGSVDETWDRITRLLERSDAGVHEVQTARFVEQLGIARLTRALASVETEFAAKKFALASASSFTRVNWAVKSASTPVNWQSWFTSPSGYGPSPATQPS